MSNLETLIFDINTAYNHYRMTIGLWNDEFEFNLISLISGLNTLNTLMFASDMKLVHYAPKVIPSQLFELSDTGVIIIYTNMGHVTNLSALVHGFEQLLIIKQNFNKSINYLIMVQKGIIKYKINMTPVLFNAFACMYELFVSNHKQESYCTTNNIFLFDISSIVDHQGMTDEIDDMEIDYELVNSYIDMMRHVFKSNNPTEYKEALIGFIAYYESFANDDKFGIIAKYEWTTYILTCYVYWGKSLNDYYKEAKMILEKINGNL